MNIKVAINLTDLNSDDIREVGAAENQIITASLEAAGHAILKLEALRWQRFIRFCHTGKFD